MSEQLFQRRQYDVMCVGLAVENIIVRPVSDDVFSNGSTQVETITMLGGGDAFNQACALAALGDKVTLVSKMADDTCGNSMKAALRRRDIDTSHIALDNSTETSSCVVLVNPDGQRSFCVYKGCLQTFGDKDVDLSWVKETKIVSIGGLFALPRFDQKTSVSLFKAAKEAGTVTVADTKYDTYKIGLNGIGRLLEYTDYFFPSYDEAVALSALKEPKDMAAFFRNRGVENVGIKLGEEGCYVKNESFEGLIPGFHAEVIDTTGAGDNYMAGLIHGILQGWSIEQSALFANAVGALAVTRIGAVSDLAYIAPVKEILAQTAQGEQFIKEVLER